MVLCLFNYHTKRSQPTYYQLSTKYNLYRHRYNVANERHMNGYLIFKLLIATVKCVLWKLICYLIKLDFRFNLHTMFIKFKLTWFFFIIYSYYIISINRYKHFPIFLFVFIQQLVTRLVSLLFYYTEQYIF